MKGKRIRKKGKISLSHYFKKFQEKDRVAIIREKGVRASFPEKIEGKCGEIIGKRGSFYLIKLKEGSKTKTFIIHPIHLRKLK